MAIKKNDFVEVEYTGRLKDGNVVFDTTEESVAKQNDIHSPNASYGSVIVCIGQNQLVKGLDAKLEGKEIGKHVIELKPEEAFGKKDAKLIQLVPTGKFREQKIMPVHGLQINFDGIMGTVKAVTGGRTIVDFNHPLSGKEVIYEVNVKRVVTDKKEQVDALFKLAGLDAQVVVEAETARVSFKKDLPEKLASEIKKKFEELVQIKIEFVKQVVDKKSAPKPQTSQNSAGQQQSL